MRIDLPCCGFKNCKYQVNVCKVSLIHKNGEVEALYEKKVCEALEA